jgi:alkylation response protein AidB-like acyl-CoA dehydrogenase
MAGLAGLSMFMVPAYEDLPDGSRKRLAHVPRIEHKLGHHASVTAQVVFEESPGVLIGERGEGFQHMLTLMNNARLGVGFECIGLCESAYRTARDYAAGRRSMG